MEWSRAMKLSVSSTRYKASATALHRLGFWLRRGATLLNGRQGLVGIVGIARNEVFPTPGGVADIDRAALGHRLERGCVSLVLIKDNPRRMGELFWGESQDECRCGPACND